MTYLLCRRSERSTGQTGVRAPARVRPSRGSCIKYNNRSTVLSCFLPLRLGAETMFVWFECRRKNNRHDVIIFPVFYDIFFGPADPRRKLFVFMCVICTRGLFRTFLPVKYHVCCAQLGRDRFIVVESCDNSNITNLP